MRGFLAARGVDYVLIAPAVEWQDDYQPNYSEESVAWLHGLEALAEAGQIGLVYTSADGWLKVAEVDPQ